MSGARRLLWGAMLLVGCATARQVGIPKVAMPPGGRPIHTLEVRVVDLDAPADTGLADEMQRFLASELERASQPEATDGRDVRLEVRGKVSRTTTGRLKDPLKLEDTPQVQLPTFERRQWVQTLGVDLEVVLVDAQSGETLWGPEPFARDSSAGNVPMVFALYETLDPLVDRLKGLLGIAGETQPRYLLGTGR